MRIAPLAAWALIAAPAGAQTMDHATMPGMAMPAATPRPAASGARRKPAPRPARPAAARRSAPHAAHDTPATKAPADPHPGHHLPGMTTAPAAQDHGGHHMPGMTTTPMAGHGGHDMAVDPGPSSSPPAGTDLPVGTAPAPRAVPGLAAARYHDAAAMRRAARAMRREHGGMTIHQALLNLGEYQVRDGRDGYRWDGDLWIGGDIDRLTIKTEGEGSAGRGVDDAEVQALYSRALDPYWNLQAGVRYDITPRPARGYATIGVEGLAPYWFDVEAALFLSTRGELLARAVGWYDQRVTQFVVLQPRVEANAAAQAMRDTGTGAGLTDIELGVRLRYDRRREFAPYVGLSWERRVGATARLARARGDEVGGLAAVAGIRAWF
ncbi:copper resistance protein B [Sphingomonas endophytica]|uniref:Copper resistance protein CopB n=1 Tax=Sphingomonas endophytica TaxID=869719 RepID=A0A147I6G8_9SPHN|nr:copper resistance protein B [Sphingomonas endophytica]KTT74414.1 copper resistance protein CopB [Sphingomonas endophytica]